jgi:chemotaxis receptor (MCP) glutamine deamidase CheD
MAETSVRLIEWAIATSGILKIDQIGFGVGVLIYSPSQKIGAGLHILAPRSASSNLKNPVMYANTAIPYVLDQLAQKGVTPPLSIAIAGGAGLLKSSSASGTSQQVVQAVKEALMAANLSVKIEETGGTKIRSMILDIDGGKIKIS